MNIEHQIKGLRRLRSDVEKIEYNVMPNSDGSFRVIKGKKFIVLPRVFSREWADRIIDGFVAMHKKHIEDIDTILKGLQNGYEQLSLSLFEERKEDANERGI